MGKSNTSKMGLNATWCMAVGGMIGGGIFSVLGVVVSQSGNLSWISFFISGLIALATAISYSNLTCMFKEGGGAFTYIKDIHHKGFAGGLSWLLIIGYILTLSVYAFTFGHYLANIINTAAWIPRVSSAIIIIIFVGINLKGVGEASWMEIITVWGKLVILLVIAGVGLLNFNPGFFSKTTIDRGTLINAVVGGASIFMAYEGFQLITYDYDDIKDPEKTILKAEILSVIAVIGVYIVVSIGTILLIGQDSIIAKKEVAIATAGKAAFGTAGLLLATVGALFSTSSAINSTLFATARLVEKVAGDREIPAFFNHTNRSGVPDRSVLFIGTLGLVFSIFGELEVLVDLASLIFLVTFGVVNIVAFLNVSKNRVISFMGFTGAFASMLILIWKLYTTAPIVMFFFVTLLIAVTLGRKYLYQIKPLK